jgi:hypothetical protein
MKIRRGPVEVWKEIPGFPQCGVSNFGRVKRLIGSRTSKAGKMMKLSLHRKGYLRVSLMSRPFNVHYLVLLAFRGERPDGLIARHLNDVKTDNRLDNLVWGTISENAQDAIKYGKWPTGGWKSAWEKGSFTKEKLHDRAVKLNESKRRNKHERQQT